MDNLLLLIVQPDNIQRRHGIYWTEGRIRKFVSNVCLLLLRKVSYMSWLQNGLAASDG